MKRFFIILIFDILIKQCDLVQADFSRGCKKCAGKTMRNNHNYQGEVPLSDIIVDNNVVEMIKNKFRELSKAANNTLSTEDLSEEEALEMSELYEDPNKSQELMARAFIDSMRKVYWKMEQEHARKKAWVRLKRSLDEPKKVHCVRTTPDKIVCTHDGFTYSLKLPPGFDRQNAVENLVASICAAVEEMSSGGELALTVAPPRMETTPYLQINVPIDLDLVTGNISFEFQPNEKLSQRSYPADDNRWPVKRDLFINQPNPFLSQRAALPYPYPFPLPPFPTNISSNHF